MTLLYTVLAEETQYMLQQVPSTAVTYRENTPRSEYQGRLVEHAPNHSMSKPPKRRASKRPHGDERVSSTETPQARTQAQQEELMQGFSSSYRFFPPSTGYSTSNATSTDTGYQTQSNFGQASQIVEKGAVTAPVPPGKVAIPALKPSHPTSSSKPYKKGRTAHACDNCRKAKAGCTGGAQCSRCKSNGSICTYSDGKRDREKKVMTKLSEESKQLRHLSRFTSEVMEALRRIRNNPYLSLEETHLAIDEVLSMTQDAQSPDEQYESPIASELDVELEDEMDIEIEDHDGSIGPPSVPLDEVHGHSSSSTALMAQQQPQHGYFTQQIPGPYAETWNNMFMNNLAPNDVVISASNTGGAGASAGSTDIGIGIGGVGVRGASEAGFNPRVAVGSAVIGDIRGAEGVQYRRASLPLLQYQQHQHRNRHNQPPGF